MSGVVLLAPMAMDATSWQWAAAATALDAEQHDYPGLGRRRVEEYGRDLGELADDIVERYPGQLHLIGVSLGGLVAQHVAVRHRPRVASLFAAACCVRNDPAAGRVWMERARNGISGELVQTCLERWFSRELLTECPDHPAVAYVRRTLEQMNPALYRDTWAAMAAHDLRGRLRAVDCPVTCFAGSDDPATGAQGTEELAAEFGRARVRHLPGPHLIHLTDPARFDGELVDHLEWAASA